MQLCGTKTIWDISDYLLIENIAKLLVSKQENRNSEPVVLFTELVDKIFNDVYDKQIDANAFRKLFEAVSATFNSVASGVKTKLDFTGQLHGIGTLDINQFNSVYDQLLEVDNEQPENLDPENPGNSSIEMEVFGAGELEAVTIEKLDETFEGLQIENSVDQASFQNQFFIGNTNGALDFISYLQDNVIKFLYYDFKNAQLSASNDKQLDKNIKDAKLAMLKNALAHYGVPMEGNIEKAFAATGKLDKSVIDAFFQKYNTDPNKLTKGDIYNDFLFAVYFDKLIDIYPDTLGKLLQVKKGKYKRRTTKNLREGYSEDAISPIAESKPLVNMIVTSTKLPYKKDKTSYVKQGLFSQMMGQINAMPNKGKGTYEDYKRLFEQYISTSNDADLVEIARALYNKLFSDKLMDELKKEPDLMDHKTRLFREMINTIKVTFDGFNNLPLSEVTVSGKDIKMQSQREGISKASSFIGNTMNGILPGAVNMLSTPTSLTKDGDGFLAVNGKYMVKMRNKTVMAVFLRNEQTKEYNEISKESAGGIDFMKSMLGNLAFEQLSEHGNFLWTLAGTKFFGSVALANIVQTKQVSILPWWLNNFQINVNDIGNSTDAKKEFLINLNIEQEIETAIRQTSRSTPNIDKIESDIAKTVESDVKQTMRNNEGKLVAKQMIANPATSVSQLVSLKPTTGVFHEYHAIRKQGSIVSVSRQGSIAAEIDGEEEIVPFKEINSTLQASMDMNVHYGKTLFESNEQYVMIKPFVQSDKSSQNIFKVDRQAWGITKKGFGEDAIRELQMLHFASRSKNYRAIEKKLLKDYNTVLQTAIQGFVPFQTFDELVAGATPEIRKTFQDNVIKPEFTKQGIYFVNGFHDLTSARVAEHKIYSLPEQLIYNDNGTLQDFSNRPEFLSYVNYMDTILLDELKTQLELGTAFTGELVSYFQSQKLPLRLEMTNNVADVHPFFKKFFYEWNYISETIRDSMYGDTVQYKKNEMYEKFTEAIKRQLPATMHRYALGLPEGVPDKSKIVVLGGSSKTKFDTLIGEEVKFTLTDGVSFSTGISMLQKQASLGGLTGQYPGVNQKSIGFSNGEELGDYVLQKHNDFALTNWMIRNSAGSQSIDAAAINKMLLSGYTFDQPFIFQNQPYFNKLQNKMTTLAYIDGKIVEKSLSPTRPYKNMYEIWSDLGGEHTVYADPKGPIEVNGTRYSYADLSSNGKPVMHKYPYGAQDNVVGNYAYSGNLVHYLMTMDAHYKGEQSIKGQVFETLGDPEAFKTGVRNKNTNIDPTNGLNAQLLEGKQVGYGEYDNYMKGVQLNPEKEVDANEGTLSTQLMGAIANAGFTHGDAMDVYKILETLAVSRLEKDSLENIDKLFEASIDPKEREQWIKKLVEFTKSRIASDLQTQSSINTLAGYILSKFQQQEGVMPFDHPLVSKLLETSISSYMNANSIRNTIPGTQMVLVPNTVELFDHNNSRYTVDGLRQVFQQGQTGFATFELFLASLTRSKLKRPEFFYYDENNNEVDLMKSPEYERIVAAKDNKDEYKRARNAFQDKLNSIQSKAVKEINGNHYDANGKLIFRSSPGEIMVPPVFAKQFGIVPGMDLANIGFDHFVKLAEKKVIKNLQDAQMALDDAQIEAAVQELAGQMYASFQESLKGLNMRIPLQSMASIMGTKVAGFLWGMNNAAMVNEVHQALTGGDYDVDKTNYVTYMIKDGLLAVWHPDVDVRDPETFNKTVDEVLTAYSEGKVDNNGLKNYIVFKLLKIANSPSHRLVAETPVNTDTVGDIASSIEGEGKKKLSKNKPSSVAIMTEQNMGGKAGVGIYAVAIKELMALHTMVHNVAKQFAQTTDPALVKQATFLPLTLQGNIYRNLSNINLPVEIQNEFIEFVSMLTPSEVATQADRSNLVNEFVAKRQLEPSTVDVLGELLNAAVDNAKLLQLGTLNAGTDFGSLYGYMTAMGVPLTDQAQLIAQPFVKAIKILMRANPLSNKKGRSADSAIDLFLKMLTNMNPDKPYFGDNDYMQMVQMEMDNLMSVMGDEFKSFFNPDTIQNAEKFAEINSRANMFRSLGIALGINGGMNATDYDIYRFTKAIGKMMEQAREILPLTSRNKYPLFDYRQFFESIQKDQVYAMQFVEMFDEAMRMQPQQAERDKKGKLQLPTIPFNVAAVLLHNPHFASQFLTVGRAANWGSAISAKLRESKKLLSMLEERGYLPRLKAMEEREYNKLGRIIDEMFVLSYYDNTVHKGISNFDLQKPEGRDTFMSYMETSFLADMKNVAKGIKDPSVQELFENFLVADIDRSKDIFGNKGTRIKLNMDSYLQTSDQQAARINGITESLKQLDRTVSFTKNGRTMSFNPLMMLLHYNRLKYKDGTQAVALTSLLPIATSQNVANEMGNYMMYIANARDNVDVSKLTDEQLVYLIAKYNLPVPETLTDYAIKAEDGTTPPQPMISKRNGTVRIRMSNKNGVDVIDINGTPKTVDKNSFKLKTQYPSFEKASVLFNGNVKPLELVEQTNDAVQTLFDLLSDC